MRIKEIFKTAYSLTDSRQFETLPKRDQNLAWGSAAAVALTLSIVASVATYRLMGNKTDAKNADIEAVNQQIDDIKIEVSDTGWNITNYSEGNIFSLNEVLGYDKGEQVNDYVAKTIDKQENKITLHPDIVQSVGYALEASKQKKSNADAELAALVGALTLVFSMVSIIPKGSKTLEIAATPGLIPAAIRRRRDEKEPTLTPS